MGLGGSLKEWGDHHGDLVKGLRGETGQDAAQDAAEIYEGELIRQFNQQQANLRPSLNMALDILPDTLTQAQAFNPYELQPAIDGFLAPVEARRGEAANDYLSSVGLDRPRAANEIATIDPRQELDLLLGTEADMFENRVALTGLGEGAGQVMSQLGQRTGANIAETNLQAELAGQQARAQGNSNIMGIASMVGSFFSDERMKDNIQEVGELDDGTKIYSWDWKPEFAEAMAGQSNIGPLAQDVAARYPDHVTTDRSGYMKVLPSLGDEVANG
ncbi:tail fiber domain-containing protein [uncultured Paraglaciecola sp.]|uniref:tail fiber domain-containing protein n=1 Tax=uncultured Paraglaciecola sp. TaxID=1765024 RepID=UPI0026220CFE|nr:tail fiber domain-containing protein [uncultured Paraglaciecola sp.]